MKSTLPSRKHQRGAGSTWIFAGFALVALFFLVTEHRAHLYGWLPYLFLAACPLMHLFHGHAGHHGHEGGTASRDADAPSPRAVSDGNKSAPQGAQHQH